MGTSGLGFQPYALLIPGTVSSSNGPAPPMTTEKKIAGFSCAAQRTKRIGLRKKNGAIVVVKVVDIVVVRARLTIWRN